MTWSEKRIASFVQKTLDCLYPDPPIPLLHTNPYTFLIAVVLSAQCTDLRVNQITPLLFAHASTPQAMSAMTWEQIDALIRPCGLSKRKAMAILQLSKDLLLHHKGEVPSSFELLEQLPGVGHKTASVVMSQVFGVPAFAVDTHIHRCAQRWGLSSGKNVVQTEKDLKRLFAREHWNRLHLQMIYFGREHCPARGHHIQQCPICGPLLRHGCSNAFSST